MSPLSSRRAKLVAAAVGSCALILLALLLLWLCRAPRTLDVRLAGLRQISSGVLCVNVVLSNGTPRTLNVVDDRSGNPAFILDERGGRGANDTYGTLLTDMVNKLRINLTPRASLTNTVWVTNPPPRFRLRVQVRDLAAEGRGMPLYRVVGKTLALKVAQWRQKARSADVWLPASVWIERKDYQQ